MATTSNIQTKNMVLKVDNHKLLAYNKSLVKDQPYCYISADEATGQTSISVDNGIGFASGDFVLIGEFGDSIAEIRTLTTGGSDTTIVLSAASDFDHFTGTKITKIPYTKIAFYRATTLTGDKTQLGTDVDITPSRIYTEYQDDTNTTGYAFFQFTDGTNDSEYSSGAAYAGNNIMSVQKIVSRAIEMTGVGYNSEYATKEQVFEDFNEAQQEISQTKDWPFEQISGSLNVETNEVEFDLNDLTYAPKYTYTKEAISSVVFGTKPLSYITPSQWNKIFTDKANTTLAADTVVGATSITLTDTTEFADYGVVYVGADALIYTDNDTDTGILSGIPVSGDGSITEITLTGVRVWQDIQPAEPSYYTIELENIKLDVPVADDLNNYDLKINYFRAIPDISNYSDVTIVPFYRAISDYVAYKIETRRRNITMSDKYYQNFLLKLQKATLMYKSPARDFQRYYRNINYIDQGSIYEVNN